VLVGSARDLEFQSSTNQIGLAAADEPWQYIPLTSPNARGCLGDPCKFDSLRNLRDHLVAAAGEDAADGYAAAANWSRNESLIAVACVQVPAPKVRCQFFTD